MNPVTGLALGRIAVGVVSLAKPTLLPSVIAPKAPPSPTLLTQWFGSREVAIGVVTLLATGSARRDLVLVGVAIDAADALTAYVGVQDEIIPRRVGLGLVGIASGAAVAGLLGLRVKKRTVLEVA